MKLDKERIKPEWNQWQILKKWQKEDQRQRRTEKVEMAKFKEEASTNTFEQYWISDLLDYLRERERERNVSMNFHEIQCRNPAASIPTSRLISSSFALVSKPCCPSIHPSSTNSGDLLRQVHNWYFLNAEIPFKNSVLPKSVSGKILTPPTSGPPSRHCPSNSMTNTTSPGTAPIALRSSRASCTSNEIGSKGRQGGNWAPPIHPLNARYILELLPTLCLVHP